MRSFLFVPGDSLRKFESGKKSDADVLILDLEDSIAPDQKIAARGITRDMLDQRKAGQKLYVRVNAFDTDQTLGDLAAVMPGRPDGIVLPKCAGVTVMCKLLAKVAAATVGARYMAGLWKAPRKCSIPLSVSTLNDSTAAAPFR